MTDAKQDLDMPIEIPGLDPDDDFDPNAGWACDIDLAEEAEDGTVVVVEREATVPPERVRFTAPAKVRRESAEEVLEGVIYNLSTHGAACSAALTLRSGERVWLRFQLDLAQEPINLLCEVIWCSERGSDCFFGLHFLSLTPDEEAAIRTTVAERSEGRAGDWTLPVLPEPPPGRRGPSPVLTAAAGMAAGITLALVLSVIPDAILGGPAPAEPMKPVEPAAVVARAAAPAEDAVARTEPKVQSPRRIDLGPVAQTPEPQPEPEAAPEPAPEPAARTEAVGAAAPQPNSDLLPRIAASPRPTGDVLRPLGTDDGLELALLADGKVVDHVSFWLDNPKRLVVDVFGRKNGFERNSYRIEHPLADQLRVGNHPGKVRFVIETTANVASRVSTKPVGSSLVVTLHRG